jgi:hypothetical protein
MKVKVSTVNLLSMLAAEEGVGVNGVDVGGGACGSRKH